jgi:hypothetical protein
MITNNIYTRVFRIKVNQKTATAYTVEKNDKQYLVSAAHNFDGVTILSTVDIYHDKKWKSLSVKVVFNSMDKGDTIVMELPFDLSPRLQIEYGMGSVPLAAPIYFFGFPFGMMTESGDLNRNFPLPFVKGGLLSSMNYESGVNSIYIDGHNNKGFSGGPVVWVKPDSSAKIIGTISGFLTENPLASATMEEIEIYRANAGLIKAFWIKDLFDYI